MDSRPRRNLLPLAGFLICLVGFFSYFFLFAVGLALAGAGVSRAFRRPETYRGRVLGPILGVLSLAVVGFFLFMTLVASRQLPGARTGEGCQALR